MAQAWLAGWLGALRHRQGPGWVPDLVGRRQIRWISHALFLMSGQDPRETRAFYAALGAAGGVPRAPLAHHLARAAPVRGADRPDLFGLFADRCRASPETGAEGTGAGMRARDRRLGRDRHPQPRGTLARLHPADLDRRGSGRGGQDRRSGGRHGHHAHRADPAQPAPRRWRAGAVPWRRARAGRAAGPRAGAIGGAPGDGDRGWPWATRGCRPGAHPS